jgi:DNA-binding MarR family transcriptional regulator
MGVSCTEASFLRLISLTAQTMRSYADQRLKKYDLTVEQLQVLKEMTEGNGQTQTELCNATDKSPANITRILDRLENKGRIMRRKNPDDRRAILVLLTNEGELLKNEVMNLFDSLGEDLLEDINYDKQRIAFEVLGAIKNKIESRPIPEREEEK